MTYVDLNDLGHANFPRLISSLSSLPCPLSSHRTSDVWLLEFAKFFQGFCICCPLCLEFPRIPLAIPTPTHPFLFPINCPQISITLYLAILLHRLMFFSITEHLKTFNHIFCLFIVVRIVNVRSTLLTNFYVYNSVLITVDTMLCSRSLELNHLA